LSEAHPAPAPPGRRPALLSIQILRAVAALGVLWHHTWHEMTARAGWPPLFNEFAVGAAGVDLFFVISGFVMVFASERMFGRHDAPRVFLARRIVRIVPLYWAVTAILLAYVTIAHGVFPPPFISTQGVVASFLFWPYPLNDGVMAPLHALGWTLNYEMFFYAVFAAAILLPRRAAVVAVVAVFAALVALGRLTALPQPLAFWFDPIILEFCFGMAIAIACREGVRLPRAASAALILAALACYAASAVWGPHLQWRAAEWGLPAAMLVAAFVLAEAAPRPGRLARAFAFVGDASYSLYLVHVLAFPLTRRMLAPWIGPVWMQVVYALALVAASVAAAIACYLLFERPITRALQKRIGGPRHAEPAFGGTRTVEG
jgi:peptidoglycan/LPS O-acetylase OafA/YrhL